MRITRGQRTIAFALIGLALLALLTLQIYRSRQKVSALNQTLAERNEVIQRALQEKDVLLREIHHRVKNNLQVISSLLSIQSRSLTDAGAVAALNEGRSRVQTMSLIHQDLYQYLLFQNINKTQMKNLQFLFPLLLLLLFACKEDDVAEPTQDEFIGQKVNIGNGQAWTFVKVDDQGIPTSIGVRLDESALENLPTGSMHADEFMLSLPSEVSVPPYNHAMGGPG